MVDRKSFLLRVDPELLASLRRWAEDDLRIDSLEDMPVRQPRLAGIYVINADGSKLRKLAGSNALRAFWRPSSK